MAAVANKTFPILCFCLGITRTFHPPYTPFATIDGCQSEISIFDGDIISIQGNIEDFL